MSRGVGHPRAFTLVEILVATSIIVALASVTFPVLVKTRGAARRATCMSQLRQIGMAMMMYQSDYQELSPRLSKLYPDYVSDPRIFVCPADSAEGNHDPNPYLEGARYLPSGVSYTYVPNWKYAQSLGWWRRPPHYGEGKWYDSTPLAMCHWHWAVAWVKDMDAPSWGADPKGWVLVLAAGGSVHRVRAETPVSEYSPAGR